MSTFSEAIIYAEMGWAVFPVYGINRGHCTCRLKNKCSSPGKHPIPRNGHKEATTNMRTIEKWLEKHENSNIGIATGEISDLFVLDVDRKNNGFASLDRLIEEHGNAITDTLCAQTGGGGSHLFYTMPDVHLRNTQGRLGAGIDTRANGGYVVGAPSTHISDRKYKWKDGLYMPSTPPASLIEDLTPKHKGHASKFSLPHLINEGSRNDILFRYACSLRAQGLIKHEILRQIQKANLERCQSKLDEQELLCIANSANKYKRGCFYPTNHFRGQILESSDLDASDKLILHTLLAHADNETLRAFPSQELIARESGLSRSTVARRIPNLKANDWLDIKQVGRSNGKQGWSNHYTLKLRASSS